MVDGVAIGAYRLAGAAEPHQDRRQYLPAAAVIGIAFEMSLDLRHELLQRRGCEIGRELAFGERRAGKARRSHCEIEPAGNERQQNERDKGHGTVQAGR